MNFGSQLKAFRLQQNMSVYRLSKKSGVPHPSIISYEKDNVSPSVNTADKLLKALGVSIVIGKEAADE